LQCPKCRSYNVKPFGGCAELCYICEDCGNIFPVDNLTITGTVDINVGTIETRVDVTLENVIIRYKNKKYTPKVEEINGKKVIVLEEEKDETYDSE